jgi:hypothetical protein
MGLVARFACRYDLSLHDASEFAGQALKVKLVKLNAKCHNTPVCHSGCYWSGTTGDSVKLCLPVFMRELIYAAGEKVTGIYGLVNLLDVSWQSSNTSML